MITSEILNVDDKIAMLFKAVKSFATLTETGKSIYHYHSMLLAFESLQLLVMEATFNRHPLLSCAHALLEIADDYVFNATNTFYNLN